MRVSIKQNLGFTTSPIPEEFEKQFAMGPQLIWVKSAFQQDGRDFSYLVAKFRLAGDRKLEQSGAGVLCQTEEEAKETFNKLAERDKRHLVAIQAPGFGTVGWATNPIQIMTEIGVLRKNTEDGKTVWIAFERDVDQDTLEAKIIRRTETTTEEEANVLARGWQNEYEQKKRAYFESLDKEIVPTPPARAMALTKSDIKDLSNAKMIALQKQWPRCFEIFERQRGNADGSISDQELEDAYLLDLVERGGAEQLNGRGGTVRADAKLIAALHRAMQLYAGRTKSKAIDTAIFLIAFNWELGWCYFSDEELSQKLGEILKIKFTAARVKKYRYRTLGLVGKHMSGPPPKAV